MPGLGVLVLVLLVVFVLFEMIVVGWVYSDARAHSPHSPFLWALVVLLSNLFGLLAYLFLGRTGQPAWKRYQ